jgi:hypothetical protein
LLDALGDEIFGNRSKLVHEVGVFTGVDGLGFGKNEFRLNLSISV